MTYLHILL